MQTPGTVTVCPVRVGTAPRSADDTAPGTKSSTFNRYGFGKCLTVTMENIRLLLTIRRGLSTPPALPIMYTFVNAAV